MKRAWYLATKLRKCVKMEEVTAVSGAADRLKYELSSDHRFGQRGGGSQKFEAPVEAITASQFQSQLRRQKGDQNFTFITIKAAIGECGSGPGVNGVPNPECQN